LFFWVAEKVAKIIIFRVWLSTCSFIISFRGDTLGLARLPLISTTLKQKSWGASLIRLWSDIIVSKPPDWGPEIRIAGYSFVEPSQFPELDPQLQSFLLRADLPVCIGFGSMPVRDPESLTALVVSAARMCGVRAITNWGRAGLGSGPSVEITDTVYVVNDLPQSILLPHVRVMVHHGGAGTVAAQLLHGVPAVCPSSGTSTFGESGYFRWELHRDQYLLAS
jgi:sterol 3beta-glucosyltransferase